jgi:hypothetical protein
MVDLRGIWRGKMNMKFYRTFIDYDDLYGRPSHLGPLEHVHTYDHLPKIWFDLAIATQAAFTPPTVSVLSGEASHYSNSDVIPLPVNGFSESRGRVQLTFFSLFGMLALFEGYLTSDREIVGRWRGRVHRDNQFLNYFGQMGFKKFISFKDSAQLETGIKRFEP